jgi:GDA1/CD39 (nucleoside phosphatase) family
LLLDFSGEEEAIYDWLGVNFLASNGDMLKDSEGSGTVSNPTKSYGALDLGGASTQISFYEPNEDIMANLFKLQIGQGKHWNLYAHSFLFFGINEATNRFAARLADGKSAQDRLVKGIYNPCLPGGGTVKQEIRTNIHVDDKGMETWEANDAYPSGNGFFQTILVNEEDHSDYDKCYSLVHELLHVETNNWCDFKHKSDCSFGGVYQPRLPPQSDHFGEFIAFSNYVHVWDFLDLPERASIAQLENATKYACSLSHEETLTFNNGRIDENEVDQYCFRSTYALNVLRGFGFRDQDHITAKKLINGHKVGWPIGAMLYEINTLPWQYVRPEPHPSPMDHYSYESDGINTLKWEGFSLILLTIFAGVLYFQRQRSPAHQEQFEYEPIKDVVSYQHNV